MEHLLNYKAFNIIRATFARNEEGFYRKQKQQNKIKNKKGPCIHNARRDN